MGFPIVWAKSTKVIWANHIHPPKDKDTCLPSLTSLSWKLSLSSKLFKFDAA